MLVIAKSNPKDTAAAVLAKNTEMAVEAIAHVLNRVREDSKFAWYMLHTESLRKCTDAYAAHRGSDPEEMHKKIIDAGVAAIRSRPPRVEELRAEVDSLQEDIAESGYGDGNDESTLQLEELLNFCRLRGERPTVDAIETALAGKSLACCLGQM